MMRHSSPSTELERTRVPERNDGETVGGARAPSPLAVCQVHLLPAFQIHVARRSEEPP